MTPVASIRWRQASLLAKTTGQFIDRFDTPTKRKTMPFFLSATNELLRDAVSAASGDMIATRKEVAHKLLGAKSILAYHPKDPVAGALTEALDHAAYALLADSANRLTERWDKVNALAKNINAFKVQGPARKVLTPATV